MKLSLYISVSWETSPLKIVLRDLFCWDFNGLEVKPKQSAVQNRGSGVVVCEQFSWVLHISNQHTSNPTSNDSGISANASSIYHFQLLRPGVASLSTATEPEARALPSQR